MKEKLYSKEFKGDMIRFFADKDEDNGTIYFNRHDIGKAMGYKYPTRSIAKLEYRYKPHFVGRVEKDKIVINEIPQPMIFYTIEGVRELCKISSQYYALDFYEWVREEVRKNAKDGIDR